MSIWSLFRRKPLPAEQKSLTVNRLPKSLVDIGGNFVNPDTVDLWSNSAVMACLSTLMDAFVEASPVLWQATGTDNTGQTTWQALPDHPCSRLLTTPNEHYSGKSLEQALLLSYSCDGNAYSVIESDGYGIPVRLWYEPHTRVEPTSKPGSFIDYYNVGQYQIAPADIIHLRWGLDPANTRKGLAPLASTARRIGADSELDEYVHSVLRNKGVPGLIVGPKSGETLSDEEVTAIDHTIATKFGGSKRGSAMVSRVGLDVQSHSANPREMDLRSIGIVGEERISGVLNTPAILAGLGAGLDRSTFANMGEAQSYLTERVLVSRWQAFDEAYTKQLLPKYGLDSKKYRIAHDLSQVKALQDDRHALHAMIDSSYSSGWIDRATAKQLAGFAVDPGDIGVYANRSEPIA